MIAFSFAFAFAFVVAATKFFLAKATDFPIASCLLAYLLTCFLFSKLYLDSLLLWGLCLAIYRTVIWKRWAALLPTVLILVL